MQTGEVSASLKIIDDKYKISKRGGSLQLTIPIDVAKKLNFSEGDYVKFLVDEENNFAMIIKKDKLPSATVNIDGLNRKAMYFAIKSFNPADMTKEKAIKYVKSDFERRFKIAEFLRSFGIEYTIVDDRLHEVIEYHNIDIGPILDELEENSIES